ncbi:hypothetical protein GCM10017710_12310 [Arthrobacter ramosus]
MRRGGLASLGNDGGCRTGSFPDVVSRGFTPNDGDTAADRKLHAFTNAASGKKPGGNAVANHDDPKQRRSPSRNARSCGTRGRANGPTLPTSAGRANCPGQLDAHLRHSGS